MTSRPLIVLFGSSHVQFSYYQGWGSTLAHAYARKADVVLRGYAGWNSRRGLKIINLILPKYVARQPALVILYFGGNDSTRPHPNGKGPTVPIEEYVQNIEKMINYIKNLSEKTRILFLSTPPINEDRLKNDVDPNGNPRRTNEDCRIYSERGLQLCRDLNVDAIDLWSAIQNRPDWKDACFIEDGIHFSLVGNQIVLKEVLNAIRQAKWEPNLHWSSLPSEFGENSPEDPVLSDGSNLNMSNLVFPRDADWATPISKIAFQSSKL